MVVAAGVFFAGGFIDFCVQAGAHYIEEGSLNDWELDEERLLETAMTTAVGAWVPTFNGTQEFPVTAIGSALVAAEASILVSTGVIIRHQFNKHRMIMMEE
jgi:hypothetical protein